MKTWTGQETVEEGDAAMRTTAGCMALLLALYVVVTPAPADWDPGDPVKMHVAQLPDPNGWDVTCAGLKSLADDWQCTRTGPVSQIHVWFSSNGDASFQLDSVLAVILADGPSVPFNMPGDVLWHVEFPSSSFTVRQYGTGNQGWYNPYSEQYVRDDHSVIWQVNVEDIVDPFIQQEDKVYWLGLNLSVSGETAGLGWKTSQDHFGNNAVRFAVNIADPDPATDWFPLYDPIDAEPLDLEFVITDVPEPASMGLLGLGTLALIRLRRRR